MAASRTGIGSTAHTQRSRDGSRAPAAIVPGRALAHDQATTFHLNVRTTSLTLPPAYDVFLRAVLCIAIAFVGGSIAAYFHVPLAYMLGAIFITMFAALAGAPVARPAQAVVLPMRVVLGVMLGSTVTPDLMDRVAAIAGSALMVPVFAVVSTACGLVYYRRVAGYSREEAFFCAVPGGLNVMTTYAEETGVDIRRVSLAHAMRITFVVILAPLATQFFVALPDVADVRNAATFLDSSPRDLVMLTAAGFVGWLIGRATRVPGATMVGPMLASAVLHVTDITSAKPPGEAIIISQVILGAYIGSRYVGEQLSVVRDAVIYAFGHVVMMLTIGLAFAYLLHIWLGVPILTGLLSFAPGGMAEIGLIALALGLDVGFVATLQVTRLITIAVFAPAAWRRIRTVIVKDT